MQPRVPSARGILRWLAGLGLGLALALLLFRQAEKSKLAPKAPSPPPASAAAPAPRPPDDEQSSHADEPGTDDDPRADDDARPLSLPSGAPPGIACAEAQQVTAFVRRELAAPAIAPTPAELSLLWADMLDPHGMWSAAPDSPLPAELSAESADMLASLHDQRPGCASATRVGRVFETWLGHLGEAYDAAFDAERSRSPHPAAAVFELAAEPIFEDDPVTRPAAELARELGHRLGAFVARFPDETAIAAQARARFFPPSAETLADIATLAALRAYVPLVDPHSAFAPLDEEWALYAGDPTLDAGSPLWGEVARTPLGARVVSEPSAPLEPDDVVLSINGLTLAGASIDQIEQAARSEPIDGKFQLRVLRQGEPGLLALEVAELAAEPAPGVKLERIRYGHAGDFVLHIQIPDVGDNLAQELAPALSEAPRARAVLLDLRGNGGGSLDAAVEVLGSLVPGAPLFPLIRQGAVSEVLRAPSNADAYAGPLAVLVDGDTASAAEMIAGAIQAYHRGLLIGARTFGKGCVQEYFDDVSKLGVLRLTTLQFVMPSGRPLQQIGLTPELTLPLAPALERESDIVRQPITFDGPDVRDQLARSGPIWPARSGALGPCADPLVCSAISRLAAGQKQGKPGPGGARAARPRALTR